ncbi:MAG TPA: hypothetical protein VFB31_19190 [Pseudolabrys sp.]|nr:hypothetical protein [Pseudolabrys sp.]
MAVPAGAQQTTTTRQRVYSNRDQTVFVNRDENGKTRTKIIVQKRSYLDPGTEPLPSERNTLDYVQTPGQRADYTQRNTIADSDRGRMFNPFDLPSLNNPWIQF